MIKNKLFLFVLAAASCHCGPSPGSSTTVSVHNGTDAATTVYVSFGSDSKILPADWPFCSGSDLTCNFELNSKETKSLPTSGYLNATFAFGDPVGCGVTKAEVNVNNPAWYDILDVSLVDGYSNNIQMTATPSGKAALRLGPPNGEYGNSDVYGLFPYGCDICVEKQNPPCGIAKGKKGCKKGTQYNPDVPCQWQGASMGGGELAVEIGLTK